MHCSSYSGHHTQSRLTWSGCSYLEVELCLLLPQRSWILEYISSAFIIPGYRGTFPRPPLHPEKRAHISSAYITLRDGYFSSVTSHLQKRSHLLRLHYSWKRDCISLASVESGNRTSPRPLQPQRSGCIWAAMKSMAIQSVKIEQKWVDLNMDFYFPGGGV